MISKNPSIIIRSSALLSMLFFCFLPGLQAQSVIGIGTVYNNSFREWTITTDDEDITGELRMRWSFRDDWTEWDLRIGDLSATIEQKWDDDPNLWEIRCNGVVVNAKTTWPNEFNRWKLSDGSHQYNWGTRYFNDRERWFITDRGQDSFEVSMYYDGDPRDWTVTDNLPADVSDAMKLAMIFLAIFHSSPKI